MGKTAKNKEVKLKRNRISFETKGKIIKLKDESKKNSELCRMFGLSTSTISTIYNAKSKAIVQKAMEECVPKQACVFNTGLRPPVLNDLDSILFEWFTRNEGRKVALTMKALQCKARSIFAILMEPAHGIFDNRGYRINKGKPTLRSQKK